MKRIDIFKRAAMEAERQRAILVANIGYPSRELYAVGDRCENFYMLGSMGLASSIGLGLALALPQRRVIALDGDGSVLMNLGTLATLGGSNPPNYLLAIVDNCSYGSTGCQPTCTAGHADLAAMARAAGVKDVVVASTPEELIPALGRSGVAVIRAEPGNAPVLVIDLAPREILIRFMEALHGLKR